jgi:hypothetical protein
MVFQYQATYSVVSNSLLKFSRLAPFGISWAVLRVPIGLIAAENRNRIGKSPKNSATQAIRCRQPTCLHHPPLALPRRTTASFWSSDGAGTDGDGLRRLRGRDELRHQLTSSSARVRRKPTIEITATIRKMNTETAAANPYWAPWAPKARR